MSAPNFIVRIPITPTDKYQMREFSSIINLNNQDLICASRDGRIFQFDKETYELKRTLLLHSSWISTMHINDNYFATGSYDSNILLTKSKDIYNYSINPQFLKFGEHNDYILSITIVNDTLISSSSDPVILLSTITKDAIISYRRINLNISVHSLLSINEYEILFGTIEGKLLTDNISASSNPKQIHYYDSPIKCLSKNQEHIAIGYLDGSLMIFGVSEQEGINQKTSFPLFQYQLLETHKFDATIVTICPFHNKFIVFTSKGTIYDLNQNQMKVMAISKPITYGYLTYEMNKSQIIPLYHIATAEKSMFCMNQNYEIIHKITGNKAYIKAQRIPHTTNLILCKTDKKEVELWNLETLTMEKSFGLTKFRTKMKELSQKPVISFPVNFDVSTGQVVLMIRQILPNLMKNEMEKQKSSLSKIIKCVVQSKIKFTAVDNHGKVIWNNFSYDCVPYWFRYLIDSKFDS